MNLNKLKALEEAFLMNYPEGFDSEELKEIAKKHKVGKMQGFVNESFNKNSFKDTDKFMENYINLISKSSLVSVFEKVKFKDCAKTFSMAERETLCKGVYEFLYGDQELGFNMQVDVLSSYQIAKWPILTVLGVYMRPDTEVLVKPSTVKGILKYFEVDEFKYNSKANYEFYYEYRNFINNLKKQTSEILRIDNAAYCGFLMMSID